jgi:hypothetical protein
MTITCCFTITKRKDDNSADFNDFTVIIYYKPNAEHLEKNNGKPNAEVAQINRYFFLNAPRWVCSDLLQ